MSAASTCKVSRTGATTPVGQTSPPSRLAAAPASAWASTAAASCASSGPRRSPERRRTGCQVINARTFATYPVFLTSAALYMLLTLPLGAAVARLERGVTRYRLGART